MRLSAAVVALVLCLHAGIWFLMRGEAFAPDVAQGLQSVSYAPFDGTLKEPPPQDWATEKVRKELAVIATASRAIRTYSSTGGAEIVAPIANEFGLKVALGAWIGKDEEKNEREIATVLEISKRNSNVNSLIIGNESLLRDEQSVASLVQKIKRVKHATQLPVTTGETWDVWLKYPELASSVDYIAAHILPYWEGIPAASAVDQAMLIYNKLRDAYPGKRIVIAEFGWPSAGYNTHAAVPGPIEQADVLRSFVHRAHSLGLDYNVIEAIDQPWKTFEGSVGTYWGIWDANLKQKFEWAGPVARADYVQAAALAVLAGLLLSIPILTIPGATFSQAALLATTANVIGSWVATIVAYWQGHYFVTGGVVAFVLALALMVPLVMIAFARMREIADVAFGHGPKRLLSVKAQANPSLSDTPSTSAPKVSIHIPAHKEPPAMLIRTLDAVAKLDYPNFECLVVMNNTPDPIYWEPVKTHCERLGTRFKFLNLLNVEGFKAGALSIALSDHTAPDAEIIGILDADYVVTSDWLRDLVPAFENPKVGLVQAPQEHRDASRSPLHEAMNSEYAGFFDIGMVQRNEANAIIVHGTMCLIRRKALEDVGGWSSDTICEDSDLGLSIMERGWLLEYTNRRYGMGLLPDSFEAFKKQRHRWAYGGGQIARKHWRELLPGGTRLTPDQKREYLMGWMSWLGAESVGVLAALLNIVSVPFIIAHMVAVPDRILTVPIVASFAISLLHFVSLYRLRCRAKSMREMMGGVVAAMSMQWTVASAVGTVIVKDHLPFKVTAKGGARKKVFAFTAHWEAVMAAALLLGAAALYMTNHVAVREINIFAAVLVLQSLPFISAVALALFEGSALNSFAYWRLRRAQLDRLLTRGTIRPARARVIARV